MSVRITGRGVNSDLIHLLSFERVELVDFNEREYGMGSNPGGGIWVKVRCANGQEYEIMRNGVEYLGNIPVGGPVLPEWRAACKALGWESFDIPQTHKLYVQIGWGMAAMQAKFCP